MLKMQLRHQYVRHRSHIFYDAGVRHANVHGLNRVCFGFSRASEDSSKIQFLHVIVHRKEYVIPRMMSLFFLA